MAVLPDVVSLQVCEGAFLFVHGCKPSAEGPAGGPVRVKVLSFRQGKVLEDPGLPLRQRVRHDYALCLSISVQVCLPSCQGVPKLRFRFPLGRGSNGFLESYT